MVKAIRIAVAGALLLALGACAAVRDDRRIAWPGPSLTADWVVYERADPADSDVARLSVHREFGMRFDYPVVHRGLSAILRFDSTAAWLVDAAQQSYSPLRADRVVAASELPGLGRSQLLAPEPCMGFPQSKPLGNRRFDDRDVEIWECRGDRQSLAIHRYDRSLGLVVYEEAADGWVNELRDIQLETPAADLFSIPKGYRKTTMRAAPADFHQNPR